MSFFAKVLRGPKPPVQTGRRSLENPSTSLADPDEWLTDVVGGEKSASGIKITREAALRYSAVYRAVNLISTDVAKLPFFVYKRTTVDDKDGKERAPEHPAYQLLRYKANSEMTAFTLRQTMTAHVLLQGNAYAYIERLGSGVPVGLILIDPSKCYPVRENGRLWYVVESSAGTRKVVPENILHIKGLGYDGLQGYSVLAKARETIGLGLAAEEYGSRFFSNDATPRVVLQHPGKLSPDAKKTLRNSWAKMHSGLERKHTTAVLQEGMEANVISIGGKDAQLIETRAHQLREIANWFGVPPHKVGDTTRTGYNSLEQENQSYLDDALDGRLVTWEQECRDKLLTEVQKEADSHVIEHVRQALVRANLTARGAFYRLATGGKAWMTPDEVRSRENMNPLPDEEKLEPPPAPVPADGNDDQEAEPPAGEDDQEAERQLLEETIARMVMRLTRSAARAARSKRALVEWRDQLEDKHRATVVAAVTPAFRVCGVAALCISVIDRIFAGVRDAVMGAVEGEGKLEDRIKGVCGECESTLAGSIVATIVEEK